MPCDNSKPLYKKKKKEKIRQASTLPFWHVAKDQRLVKKRALICKERFQSPQKVFIHLTHQKIPKQPFSSSVLHLNQRIRKQYEQLFSHFSQWRARTLPGAPERNGLIIYNSCPRALMLHSPADPKCGRMLEPPLRTRLLLVYSQFQ